MDVKPKTEIEADMLYSREAGFKDVLAGAYLDMTSPSLYGRNLTFGMVDVLGQVYPYVSQEDNIAISNYDYEHATVEGTINSVWQTSYKTIANLNHLITYLEKADLDLFLEDNYNVILGEAIGLRAYIHMDLLRLFAPSYLADPHALAIPYVTEYAFTTTPQYSVSAVADSIMRDFELAAELLELSDPLVTGREISNDEDEGYLLDREYRLNYFAVKASMARLYLYMGDLSNAAVCAKEVIDSPHFAWVSYDDVSTSSKELSDRTFSAEHVFVLENRILEENTFYYVYTGSDQFMTYYSFDDYNVGLLYPTSTDWRRDVWYSSLSMATYTSQCLKLAQMEDMIDQYRYKQPLIRLSELYLIAAEAAVDTNPAEAEELVKVMMVNRGELASSADDLTMDVSEAIFQEYRRDFPCEGVLFHYYKRLDSDYMTGVYGFQLAMDKEKYVLPMPAEEIEFGNRD